MSKKLEGREESSWEWEVEQKTMDGSWAGTGMGGSNGEREGRWSKGKNMRRESNTKDL